MLPSLGPSRDEAARDDQGCCRWGAGCANLHEGQKVASVVPGSGQGEVFLLICPLNVIVSS